MTDHSPPPCALVFIYLSKDSSCRKRPPFVVLPDQDLPIINRNGFNSPDLPLPTPIGYYTYAMTISTEKKKRRSDHVGKFVFTIVTLYRLWPSSAKIVAIP